MNASSEGAFPSEEMLETLDPHPDIHALFVHYSALYFQDALGGVSCEWSSKRMTLCGGTTQKVPGGAIIKLSEPLLKFRAGRDIKDVLLHEMIHAYCMVQGIRDDDPTGHGTAFKSIMHRINTSPVPDSQRPPGGYSISIFHTMFDEVEHYRQHQWECDRCAEVVKRAMNRPPQEADCRSRVGSAAACTDGGCRFHMHVKTCGGKFIKIKEPEGFQAKKGKKTGDNSGATGGGSKQKPITEFFRGMGNVTGALQSHETDADAPPHPALIAAGAAGRSAAPVKRDSGSGGIAEASAGDVDIHLRRRLAAEAAMRRLVEGAAPGSTPQPPPAGQPQPMQQPRKQQRQDVESIDLVSSDEDEGGNEQLPGMARGDNQVARGSVKEETLDSAVRQVACPLCGHTWQAGTISNGDLNLHIDQCLGLERV